MKLVSPTSLDQNYLFLYLLNCMSSIYFCVVDTIFCLSATLEPILDQLIVSFDFFADYLDKEE